MKKALFSVLVMGVLASPAFAGVDLTWDFCSTNGGVADKSLLCGDGEANRLFATWTQPSTLTGNFLAADYVIDLQSSTPTVPAFWDIQSPNSPTSCNFFYILDKARPTGCTAANAWGFNGGSATATLGYGAQFGGQANRGRIVGSVFRTAGTNLTAGTTYYLLHLDFFGDAENNGCPGCTVPTALVLNQVTVLSSGATGTGVEDAPIPVFGPGLVSQCGSTFGATSICSATPTKNRTWGALKSLYR